MSSTKEILLRLRVLRMEKRLRQSYLARRLGIDRTTYARKEKGTIPITTEEWLKIAGALDEEMDYFFISPDSADGGRERLLLKLYRSLSPEEQSDLVASIRLMLKGIRKKAVQDTLERLARL